MPRFGRSGTCPSASQSLCFSPLYLKSGSGLPLTGLPSQCYLNKGSGLPLTGLPSQCYLNKGSGLSFTVLVAMSFPSTLRVTL
jgi:hypothetical protein